MISVLYKPDLRAVFSSLTPLVLSRYKNIFRFHNNIESLKRDSNKSLLIVRYFKDYYKNVTENQKILCDLKNQYHIVAYFDDGDGADSVHFELFPYLDYYFKSQVLSDFSHYFRNSYGRQLYSDYFHNRNGITDDKADIREPLMDSDQLKKLSILWNLGIFKYPKQRFKFKILEQALPYLDVPGCSLWYSKTKRKVFSSKKTQNKIQARFGYAAYSNSIGYQRKIFLQLIEGDERFLTGRIKSRKYNRELKNIAAVLSPFGWGEVCFRDFESIINSSLLIKPNMSHIKTFPNIFFENETYIPISWDGDNLLTNSQKILEMSETEITRIKESATNCYFDELAKLDEKVENLIERIAS